MKTMTPKQLNAALVALGLLVVALAAALLVVVRERPGEDDHTRREAAARAENRAHGHAEGEGESAGDHVSPEPGLMLSEEALKAAGVTFATVETKNLALRLPVLGKITLNENRTVHLHARYPGVIVEVTRQLGERVRKGEVLARIESNESLEPYTLTAPKDGVVIGRHAAVGESVTPERELFTVSDLSVVWVDFQVYRSDFSRLRTGQTVRVEAEGTPAAPARLSYLAPGVEGHSQALLARAELPNADGVWTLGLFVRGAIAVEGFTARAVRREALQEVEGRTVVFVREKPGVYVPHPVVPGRRDGDWVELVDGPSVGSAYVVGNSYLLKAELGKGEAGHDH